MESIEIKKMFESIAFSYDLQNSILSMGRDTSWRRTLVRYIRAGKSALVLDAATGTGEICLEICTSRPGFRTIGLDISPEMLTRAKKKIGSGKFKKCTFLALGDSRLLPIKSHSIDTATMAFGIRNIKERNQVLGEFRRVLKDNGQLLIMEFDIPSHPIIGPLYRFYFEHILPPVGNLLSRTTYAYTYLVQSVHEFPSEKEFCHEIESAGFSIRHLKELSFGVARLYEAVKK